MSHKDTSEGKRYESCNAVGNSLSHRGRSVSGDFKGISPLVDSTAHASFLVNATRTFTDGTMHINSSNGAKQMQGSDNNMVA
ncbi:hypothetical protein Nepgr_009422 [Nepenthes gracilis]|uniref:Uncharacterized protein n=1 Tax=Nepenthes gracilis TaxID=150966 RepID=A0AAD3SAU2_NEPGR|nr:hypothetical protein Nepgr_009422 [Nepenthes gracilis]